MDAYELAEILYREAIREFNSIPEPPILVLHPADFLEVARKWPVMIHCWDDPFWYVHIQDFRAE